MSELAPFQLAPEYRDYVWGGGRLRAGERTAEAWIVYEKNRVITGPHAGKTLADLSVQYGAELLGERVIQSTGERFPLLIKLLDCAEWLSLQVHPNNQQAEILEGTGEFGKTEAWHILEAEAGAHLIAGLKPGSTAEAMKNAVGSRAILDIAKYLQVINGDTIYMAAGTIHALGPGLLVYEVQQTSDLTYRVYDWDRPQTGGRILHIPQSLAVANPAIQAYAKPAPEVGDGDRAALCSSPYFLLEMLCGHHKRIQLETQSKTFYVITLVSGSARLHSGETNIILEGFDSVLLPACGKEFFLEPLSPFKALSASIP